MAGAGGGLACPPSTPAAKVSVPFSAGVPRRQKGCSGGVGGRPSRQGRTACPFVCRPSRPTVNSQKSKGRSSTVGGKELKEEPDDRRRPATERKVLPFPESLPPRKDDKLEEPAFEEFADKV